MVAQMVKNVPAVQKTRVRPLGQEDPLEKGMATHCRILPGKAHGQSGLVGYSPWARKESNTPERLALSAEKKLLPYKLWRSEENYFVFGI